MSDHGVQSQMQTRTSTTIRRTTTTNYDGEHQTYEEVYSDDNFQPIEERFGNIQKGKNKINELILTTIGEFYIPNSFNFLRELKARTKRNSSLHKETS